jgi:hypothetical protein
MRKSILFLLGAISLNAYAQNGVAVNTTGAVPANKVMLDVSATDKGMLLPRMTTAQRNTMTTSAPALSATQKGMQVIDTDLNNIMYWDGAAWVMVTNANANDFIKNQSLVAQNATFNISGTGKMGSLNVYSGAFDPIANFNPSSATIYKPLDVNSSTLVPTAFKVGATQINNYLPVNIGSGAANHLSGLVDINASNKGIYIPRVALTSLSDVNTVQLPNDGCIVYNTTDNAELDPGLHFFQSGRWNTYLLRERTGSVEPAVLTWDHAYPVDGVVTKGFTYVVGPYTVPSSGWYSISFRDYFFYTSTVPTGNDINPVVGYSINENDATSSTTAGQIWEARFVIGRVATNTPPAGFQYLKAGANYYLKYLSGGYNETSPAGNVNSGLIDVYETAERRVFLKPFR